MIVFDASALLAYLRGELGADLVREQLLDGGVVGAANWSEVAQKVTSAGAAWDVARALLLSYPLDVEPVGVEDAERAAELWSPGSGLSLADRMCLALADRMGAPALTADTAWVGMPGVRHIRPTEKTRRLLASIDRLEAGEGVEHEPLE